MSTILIPLPGNESFAEMLATHMSAEIAQVRFHHFPDGETYMRFETDVTDKTVWLVCTLDRPDPKFVPLMITAETAKDLGASRVGLIAPYLAYMRQDTRFRPGEAVSSAYFASVLSCIVDAIVTVDPHLHRRSSLNEIYRIPTAIVHAAPTVADWIRREIATPLLVGPDAESKQWVAEVAKRAGAPHVVLQKTRRGDRDVEVSVPDVERWSGHTPVLVDDIASTAHTMIETVGHLRRAGMSPPICVAVHAIFAGDAYQQLEAAGVSRIVSCNTIPHPSNALDLTPSIASEVQALNWSATSCGPPTARHGRDAHEGSTENG
jgi:ribose-phosphate pyrophosphokinase